MVLVHLKVRQNRRKRIQRRYSMSKHINVCLTLWVTACSVDLANSYHILYSYRAFNKEVDAWFDKLTLITNENTLQRYSITSSLLYFEKLVHICMNEGVQL